MRRVLPNQIYSFDYPEEAWEWAKNIIASFGDNIVSEDGKLCREVRNLHLTVLNPSERWPLKNSNWSIIGLNKYAEQLLSPENPGFDYTYGERLFAFSIEGQAANQINYIIRKLKQEPSSRRAIAVTWDMDDQSRQHVPCLQLIDFLFRGGKLNLTAYFRSHDIERAYPCNLYGLNKLLEYVAREAGMEPDSITTISASAHIYVE